MGMHLKTMGQCFVLVQLHTSIIFSDPFIVYSGEIVTLDLPRTLKFSIDAAVFDKQSRNTINRG